MKNKSIPLSTMGPPAPEDHVTTFSCVGAPFSEAELRSSGG